MGRNTMLPLKEGSECFECNTVITSMGHLYKGNFYCLKCYIQKVGKEPSKGSDLNKNRKLSTATYRRYQAKNLPCIRCGKTKNKNRKITEQGPVCNSCARYFREPKKCKSCGTKKLDVANRNLNNGSTSLLCQSCFQRSEQVACSLCTRRRQEFFYNFSKKHICKNCLTLPPRYCKYCTIEIPAGSGHICRDCSYRRTLKRRMCYLRPLLNNEFQRIFNEFSEWLVTRKDVHYTAIKIGYYFEFIYALNNLSSSLNRFPSYLDIVNNLAVAKTRQYLLVTVFLSEIKAIKIDSKIKDEFSNLDMIDRYLNYFEPNSNFGRMINSYYDKLELKLKDGKTSIRSVRLSLTPAVNFLKNCMHYGFSQPSQKVLEGFLWSSPGQRAAITGFITFLIKNYHSKISLASIPKKIIFRRPYLSKKMLKQRFILILRESKEHNIPDGKLLRVAISYLHGIEIPKFVKIDRSNIVKNKAGIYYLRLTYEKFYITTELKKIINGN